MLLVPQRFLFQSSQTSMVFRNCSNIMVHTLAESMFEDKSSHHVTIRSREGRDFAGWHRNASYGIPE